MIHIPHAGLYFGIAFIIMLLSSWLMAREGRFFFTKDPLRRKFTMLEMEFPSRSFELAHLINGIYLLPDDAKKTVKSVKNSLLLDYLLFIPAVYGGIFILCMHISEKLTTDVGRYAFVAMAWTQVISFVLDYIENTYFWVMLGRQHTPIPKPDPMKPQVKTTIFKLMEWLEYGKWGFALIGFVCGLSTMAYFWVSGNFF